MKLLGLVQGEMRGADCNLDEFVQMKGHTREMEMANPYLDAQMCALMVQEAARHHHADYTHGGYGEDRSVLWRGSYLEDGEKFIHLGHDTNVAAMTPLYMPFNATVIAVGDDTETFGTHGWGRWCIVRQGDISNSREESTLIFIFAHLGDLPQVGDMYGEGEPFATVGTSETNGGWYPHVHTQVVDVVQHPFFNGANPYRSDWQHFMTELDGYASAEDFHRDAGCVYHDPLKWIR